MNQYERLEFLIGTEKLNKLQNIKVLILGIGGVGSMATEVLARSGIKKLVLIDYDDIEITNLNRQIMTNYENIGLSKVEEMKKRILTYNKDIKIKTIKEKIEIENINIIFDEKPDYIVDACDNSLLKEEIIKQVQNKKIKLISAMATGNKLDPSRLRIMDIRETTYDPLAKRIRKNIKEEKIKNKIMVISSDEKPIKAQEKIASISFVPGTAGLLAASYIVNDVIKDDK
jgi:Dinucleotide-utilizing enzymes involved in molybdopterin and thiamine biosynthesis family 1